MKNKYRLFCAALIWVAISLQYVVLARAGELGGWGETFITFLSYFTILTNILAALAFTAPSLRPENKLRIFFERQIVRAAIALYILVVMVVYWTLLAPIHNPVGISAVINVGTHLVFPCLYIFDWFKFAEKDTLSFKHIPLWIIYPLGYGIYTIIRGAMSGTYPYPFMDVATLGGFAVFLNMLGFTAFYAIGAAIFIALGRRLGNPNRRA